MLALFLDYSLSSVRSSLSTVPSSVRTKCENRRGGFGFSFAVKEYVVVAEEDAGAEGLVGRGA